MLSSQEFYTAAVFFAVVLFIYIVSLRFLCQWAWQRWVSRKSKPLNRWNRRLRTVSWTLAIIGLLCVVWGYCEPYWPEVTQRTLTSKKLAGLTRPIRIVHLSDLHCDSTPRAEDTVVQQVEELQPDLIVITGDYANSPEGMGNTRKILTALAKLAPTYITLGNCDQYFPESAPWDNTGVIPIGGQVKDISIAGARILLGGADYADGYQLENVLNIFRQSPQVFNLLLYHHPNQIRTAAESGAVDLMLLGHTHGGQVCLPFYGAMVTLSGEGKEWEAGRYELNGMTAYINRGIGMEGRKAPRVRFLSRPEVTLWELKPPDQKPTSGAPEK